MVHRGCCSELNWSKWRNGFLVKGAVWSRQLDPGPLGFLFQLIGVSESSDFGDLSGAWVTHMQEELSRWCMLSVSSCNYILHLLRASRLDCESWGKKKWLQLSGALEQMGIPGGGPFPRAHRSSKSPEAAAAWARRMKRERERTCLAEESHKERDSSQEVAVGVEGIVLCFPEKLLMWLTISNINNNTPYVPHICYGPDTVLSILHAWLHFISTTTLWGEYHSPYFWKEKNGA